MIKIHVPGYDSEQARERVREIVPHAGKQREGDLMSAVGTRGDAYRACGAYLWNLSSTQLRARAAA